MRSLTRLGARACLLGLALAAVAAPALAQTTAKATFAGGCFW